ncbi:MAG: hypothetical protein MZU97_07840 [Bacillus subtilis]|nr:hypothetical protein [Bacillus subtilis]
MGVSDRANLRRQQAQGRRLPDWERIFGTEGVPVVPLRGHLRRPVRHHPGPHRRGHEGGQGPWYDR